mgnify:CR=1 FL=1
MRTLIVGGGLSGLALADALELLIKNPELARGMGKRGRERLELEFSAQQVNDATLALYRKMLAQS